MNGSTARAWAWGGAALALAGVVAWFVLASATLDADGGSSPDRPPRGALRLESAPAVAPFSGLTATDLELDGDCAHVVVADDDAERIQGLRGRRNLGPYDAMLFVFDAPTTVAFTMSGVPVALDIGFYGSDGRPVSRLRMDPCPRAEPDCPVYRAGGEFRYALETKGGRLRDGPIATCPS